MDPEGRHPPRLRECFRDWYGATPGWKRDEEESVPLRLGGWQRGEVKEEEEEKPAGDYNGYKDIPPQRRRRRQRCCIYIYIRSRLRRREARGSSSWERESIASRPLCMASRAADVVVISMEPVLPFIHVCCFFPDPVVCGHRALTSAVCFFS